MIRFRGGASRRAAPPLELRFKVPASMRESRYLPFLLFLFTFALAALYAWRTPMWLAPDEPAHYAYVRHVATTGRPPVLGARCYDEAYKNRLTASNFREEVDFSRFCYEGHQPPLFYYLAAPLYFASGGSLLFLRLFCALLGAGVVLPAWGVVRAMGAGVPLAFATTSLVALIPQHLFMIGSLNNDALTFLVVALSVWQMVRLLRMPGLPTPVEWLKLGFLLGLALITKTLAWVVVPLAIVTVVLLAARDSYREALRGHVAMAVSIAVLFILPWFARNVAIYEGWDLMGLQRHDEIAVGQLRTETLIQQRGLAATVTNGLRTTYNSFWGQFGWMKAPLQENEYRVLMLFSVAALLGLVRWLFRRAWREEGIDGRVLLLFTVWGAMTGSLVFYYNLEFVQYQGRYLFPALTPVAFFFMVGLGSWLNGRLRMLPWGALLLFLLYLNAVALLVRLTGMLHY